MNSHIIFKNEEGEDSVVDVFSELSNNRILFINGEITDNLSVDICSTLLLLNSENKKEKIALFINSRGGNIRNIFAIYDTIKLIKAPVKTICTGAASDGAALLLAAGEKGSRLATPNSVISFAQLEHYRHNMSDLTDAKILLDCFKRDNKNMLTEFSKCVKKPYNKVLSDFKEDRYFTAPQARTYGIIDKIMGKNK